MAEERLYVVPLKDYFLNSPKYKRAKKAITGLREFVYKHTRKEKVLIDPLLSEYIWKNGIKNPPRRVKVKVIIEDTLAKVQLPEKSLLWNVEQEKNKETEEKSKVDDKGKEVSEVSDKKESDSMLEKEKKVENSKLTESSRKNNKNNKKHTPDLSKNSSITKKGRPKSKESSGRQTNKEMTNSNTSKSHGKSNNKE